MKTRASSKAKKKSASSTGGAELWGKRFLRRLRQGWTVTDAAADVGIGTSAAYHQRRTKPKFRAQWAEAQDASPMAGKSRAGKPIATDWWEPFLAALAELPNVLHGCEAAGVGRRTAYEHREKFPDFAARWDDAIEEGVDRIERSGMRRANEQSDALTKFFLTSHRAKYRQHLELTGKGGGPIQTETAAVVMVLPDNGRGDHTPGQDDSEEESS